MHARIVRGFVCALLAACALGARADAAQSAFDRLAASVASPRGYTMRVDSHEERGDRSEDLSYVYERSPNDRGVAARSRIVVVEGRGTGTTITSIGADNVTISSADGRRIATVAVDVRLATTLRGATVLAAGLEAFIACASAHRAALIERPGPAIDGRATVALVLDRRRISACPGDAPPDGDLAADVVYVAANDGAPLLRKRYAGRRIVVRWRIREFATGANAP